VPGGYGGAVTSDGVLGGIGPIAYGCWRFAGTDVATARSKIETALEVGMTLIDTADIYGYDGSAPAPAGGFGAAEELLGRVLSRDAGAP
jgi:aryl-alcohol dehydrogenase-like predicted oxidoreductase